MASSGHITEEDETNRSMSPEEAITKGIEMTVQIHDE